MRKRNDDDDDIGCLLDGMVERLNGFAAFSSSIV